MRLLKKIKINNFHPRFILNIVRLIIVFQNIKKIFVSKKKNQILKQLKNF